MTSEALHALERALALLAEDRRTICVDGDAVYQRGFFSGYECAHRVIERIAGEYAGEEGGA